jgi:GxxExxY protein
MRENELAAIVIDCGLKVHRKLGPGLLESVYEECLHYEILKKGLKIERQKILPVEYDNIQLTNGYRLDLIVEDKLIIELKAVEDIHELHFAQLLTYLKLSKTKLGLLINFNVPLFKDGVRRVVNRL